MLVIDFYGNLRSYFVSSTQGYEPYHTFSFGECLLTAAVYVPSFNILILSFPITTLSPKVILHKIIYEYIINEKLLRSINLFHTSVLR